MRPSTITFDYHDAATNHHLHLPITAFKVPESDEAYKALEALLEELTDYWFETII